MDPYILGWVIAGSIFILLEFAVPGAILSFLGIASLVVAGLIYGGLLEGVVEILIAWFMISLFLVIIVRTLFLRMMPGESTVEVTDELADALGDKVEVLSAISPNVMGRVRYRDTTWDAISDESFSSGDQAVISGRIGNRWVIALLKPTSEENL